MADDEDDDAKTGENAWKAKWQSLKERHTKANARIAELEAQVQSLEPKAATVDTLTKRVGEVEKERDTERSGRAFDRAVYGRGITDPEGIELIALQYGRLPEPHRPAPAAWLEGLTKEADKAPKWLQPYLPQSAQGQGQQGGQAQGAGQQGAGGQQGQQRANPNAGVVSSQGGAGAGGGSQPTPAEIQAARAAALAGNTEAWTAMQQRLGFQPLPKFGA